MPNGTDSLIIWKIPNRILKMPPNLSPDLLFEDIMAPWIERNLFFISDKRMLTTDNKLLDVFHVCALNTLINGKIVKEMNGEGSKQISVHCAGHRDKRHIFEIKKSSSLQIV